MYWRIFYSRKYHKVGKLIFTQTRLWEKESCWIMAQVLYICMHLKLLLLRLRIACYLTHSYSAGDVLAPLRRHRCGGDSNGRVYNCSEDDQGDTYFC
jgi:hypothetical protein